MQKLRCHLCGKVFTAPAPEDVGPEKYDHTVASMIGLLKYGSGLPFNRVERLQGNCEIPLAASTQWEIVRAAALLMVPAYEELTRQAAQGEVVYNDDSTVKILELMGQRLEKSPPADDPHDPDRTGLFTAGVVATRAGNRIALFFSGRQHAGENLLDVLKHRATDLDAPIQMCDGLSRNLPQGLDTIVANCLAHGRRNFVELYDRFPDQCRYVPQSPNCAAREATSSGMSSSAKAVFLPGRKRPQEGTQSAALLAPIHPSGGRWARVRKNVGSTC
jgi:hypothetical protein